MYTHPYTHIMYTHTYTHIMYTHPYTHIMCTHTHMYTHPHSDIIMDIIEEAQIPAMRPDNLDAQQMFKNALGVLRSLAMYEDCVPAMIRLSVTERMSSMLTNRAFVHDWPLVFETLGAIAINSKEERKKMQGPLRVLERVLGSASSRNKEDRGFLQSGQEPYAANALRLVESLLTKDSVRLHVMQDTCAPLLISNVLDSQNAEIQGAICRIISRLCDTQWCRQELKAQGLQDRICAAFCTAGSAFVRAGTSMALAALVSVQDDDVAERAAPVAIGVIRKFKHTDPEEVKQVILPGALMVASALARRTDVQNMVVSAGLIPLLVAVMGMDDVAALAKEHAAHVLGSIALQQKYQAQMTNLMDTLPNLMCMIKLGSPPEMSAAARTIQHLTAHGSDFRTLVADYKHVSLEVYTQDADMWTGMSAVSSLLRPDLPPKCWEYGAGIFRNVLGIEDVRQRVMRKYSSSDSALRRLIVICEKGTTQAKTNAAAALGNLSSSDPRREVVGSMGGIPPLVKMLSGEGRDPTRSDADPEVLTESRLCALRTLGLLAHDEVKFCVCVYIIFESVYMMK